MRKSGDTQSRVIGMSTGPEGIPRNWGKWLPVKEWPGPERTACPEEGKALGKGAVSGKQLFPSQQRFPRSKVLRSPKMWSGLPSRRKEETEERKLVGLEKQSLFFSPETSDLKR